MRWQLGRRSQNVEDRRGSTGRGTVAVGGGVGVLIMAVVAMLLGVDPRIVLEQTATIDDAPYSDTTVGTRSPEEDQLADFVSVVLADTEDTWNSLPPDLQALFTGENAWRLVDLFGHQFDEDEQMFRSVIEETYSARGKPEIYVLPEAERGRWIEACQPLWEQWVQEVTPLVGESTARAILSDAIKFGKEYEYTGFCQECEETLHEWGATGH